MFVVGDLGADLRLMEEQAAAKGMSEGTDCFSRHGLVARAHWPGVRTPMRTAQPARIRARRGFGALLAMRDDELRGDDACVQAQGDEVARAVMGAGTGFHGDDAARRQLGAPGKELVTRQGAE